MRRSQDEIQRDIFCGGLSGQEGPRVPKIFADPEVVKNGFNPSPKNDVFLFWIESRFDDFEVVKYDLKAEKRRFFVLD